MHKRSVQDSSSNGGVAGRAVDGNTDGVWDKNSTTYTGPTTVTAGTLALATARSLGEKTEVAIAEGATLELKFEGEMPIRKLYLDGKPQPAGRYDAKNSPKYIHGNGVLKASAYDSEP